MQDMYRKGPAYAVTATGRHGNRVLLMVDGHSGVIIGMSVLAAVVPVIPETAPNAVFLDDSHPFGAVVPEVIYDHWDHYNEPQWIQPGPPAIAVKPTYAPFEYAVPFKFVHTSPRSHKSYALAPPKFHGMKLRNSSGQQNPLRRDARRRSGQRGGVSGRTCRPGDLRQGRGAGSEGRGRSAG